MGIFINKNCKYIKGAKNAAIYKLETGEVFALNEIAKSILDKFLNNENCISTKKEKDFINDLFILGLISRQSFKMDNNEAFAKPKTSIKYAWLELTSLCNLKCIHCYGEFGVCNTKKTDIMSVEDWKKVIDNLIKLNCTGIQFIGGEPMIYNGFWELLEYVRKCGMKRIDVFTNATCINDLNLKKLKENNVSIRVSLYGHTADIHERVTGIKNSFEKTQRALKLLKEYNIPTTIAIIMMKENENELLNIKNYIRNLGYKYTGFDVIRPSCQNFNSDFHKVSNIELLKERYNIYPKFTVTEKQFNLNKWYNSCWNSKLAITSNGDVIPCIFARDDMVGNVKKDEFRNILKQIEDKWLITKDKVEVCKDCEFRYACHDCRPLAKAINGNTYSKYPRCCYDPYKGTWEDIEKCTKEKSNK